MYPCTALASRLWIESTQMGFAKLAPGTPVSLGVLHARNGYAMSMPTGKQQESGAFARALSAQVRATLARKRITAKQMAEDCGMSPNYLGKRLRDEASFTLNDIESICDALDEDLRTFVDSAIDRGDDGPITRSLPRIQ